MRGSLLPLLLLLARAAAEPVATLTYRSGSTTKKITGAATPRWHFTYGTPARHYGADPFAWARNTTWMDYGPGSTWRHYLTRVYGSSKLDVNIEDVDVLLPDKGAPRPPPLPEGKSYAACPKSDDEPFGRLNWHAPLDLGYLRRYTAADLPRTPYANNTWVEVSHCGHSAFETKGAYFYGLKGSGLWIHVGKSIAFETHEDAALYFLQRPCGNGNAKDEELGIVQCDADLSEIVAEAKTQGWDSMQFTRHCDAFCGGRGAALRGDKRSQLCIAEIVLIGVDGSEACPKNVEFRQGANASQPCVCEAGPLKSQRGPCATCAPPPKKLSVDVYLTGALRVRDRKHYEEIQTSLKGAGVAIVTTEPYWALAELLANQTGGKACVVDPLDVPRSSGWMNQYRQLDVALRNFHSKADTIIQARTDVQVWRRALVVPYANLVANDNAVHAASNLVVHARAPVFRETFKDLWRDVNGFYSKPPPQESRKGRSCPDDYYGLHNEGKVRSQNLYKRYAQKTGCVCVRHGIYWGKGKHRNGTNWKAFAPEAEHIFSYHIQMRKKKACAPLCLRPIAKDGTCPPVDRVEARFEGGADRKERRAYAFHETLAATSPPRRCKVEGTRRLSYDHWQLWQLDKGEAMMRLGGLAAALAGREEPPTEWTVRRDDVQDLRWLANGTRKEVWAGRAHDRTVILKRLVRSRRDGRATSPASDQRHRAELLGELYFLEWLRGAPGIPELLGAWTEAGGPAYVVSDGGESYATKFPTDGRLVRTEPIDGPTAFALAASLLDCFRSFAEIGGYFLDDLSPHQFAVRDATSISLIDGPRILSNAPVASYLLAERVAHSIAGFDGRACADDKACPATRHHHSCVGGNSRFANFAGSAAVPVACRDGSVAAPEARGWCIEGNCRPISAKTHVYDVGSRPWALPRLANATTSNRARKFLENLIERMTAADPDARPTLTEALDLLAAKRPHIT